MIAKLSKSTIYTVNGRVARYIGDTTEITPDNAANAYAFKHHADTFTANAGSVDKATGEQVRAYLTPQTFFANGQAFKTQAEAEKHACDNAKRIN